jgi:peptidoglycan/LPS O-acetylase OafA/YrhL
MTNKKAPRFMALDGWRGVAACMVVLFHVRAHSHISELEFVRHSFLFVDFFFVLSGFVIAATYGERLAAGFSLWHFMLLRFGRLYPLHLAVLAVYVSYELIRRGALSPADPVEALITRLLLIHSLGPFDVQLWNTPSWSISTEFFAYLAFALVAAALGARTRHVLFAAVVASPVVLYAGPGAINDHGYELVRCLYGFAMGALAWQVFLRFGDRLPAGSLPEAIAAAAVAVFVTSAGKTGWSIAAPVVFGAVVLVFASERGAGGRLLSSRPFAFLGAASYSIYMVHLFVAQRLAEGLGMAKSLGIGAVDRFGTDRWAGDALILGCLALVIALAAVTYRYLEVPARDWFRALAEGRLRLVHHRSMEALVDDDVHHRR